jgi:prepilin-type N-terminal cleavage/methylation domain-containing protein
MYIIGRPRQAFTLVEIIVVLLIMSVILTMTAVSLSGAMGGVAARESAGRLLVALRYARYYSAVHGCQCRVTFSRQKNSYDLSCRPDPEKDEFEAMPGGHKDTLDGHVRFLAIMIQPRASEAEDQDVITFEPTGECDGANIAIGDGRVVYTLIVSPYSGIVRLHKGVSSEIPSDREDLDV